MTQNPFDPEELAPRLASWRSLDGERLLGVLRSLVAPLGESMPMGTEVVLHDLSLIPNSIVAIHGSLTGRKVGDHSQSLTLERITEISDDDYVTYQSVLQDGRRVRSTTITIRDVAGNAVAALCINVDMSPWEALRDLAGGYLGESRDRIPPAQAAGPKAGQELGQELGQEVGDVDASDFVRNLDELAELMIAREISAIGVPLELMKKSHKLAVVRSLRARGLFMLKEAVQQVADALEVTRFTVYNYLNQIESEESGAGAD